MQRSGETATAARSGRMEGPRGSGVRAGQSVGRYRVVGPKRGAASGIFTAYDTTLGRRVELRVLSRARSQRVRASGLDNDRATLLTEAHAIARISHPTVAPVFDVGALPTGVFIASEWVDGLTLREWLEVVRPTPQQCCEVMMMIGEGIQAAHRHGILHRNIRPENIIVTDGGEPYILNFGSGAAARRDDTSRVAIRPLIQSDTIHGVASRKLSARAAAEANRYVAPEVLRGVHSDPRSDQYSFAVMAYETIFDGLPVVEVPMEEQSEDGLVLGRSVHIDSLPPSTARAQKVPIAVHQALVRAMANDAGDRLSSIADLIALLREVDWDARKRRVRQFAVFLIPSTLVAGLVVSELRSPEACRGGDSAFSQVWSADGKNALEQKILASNLSYALDVWNRVSRAIDDRTRRWVSTYDEVCHGESTAGRATAELDASMACLNQARQETIDFVRMLSRADPGFLESAVDGVRGLSRVGDCVDPDFLNQWSKGLELSPQARAQVPRLRTQLTRAEMLASAGELQDSGKMLDSLTVESGEIGAHEIAAHAWLSKSNLLHAQTKLIPAIVAAQRSESAAVMAGNDYLVVEARIRRTFLEGYMAGNLELGRELIRSTHGRYIAAGEPVPLRIDQVQQTAIHYSESGAHREAIEAFKKVVELQRWTNPDPSALCNGFGNLGIAQTRAGLFEDAIVSWNDALDIAERAFGPGHPRRIRSASGLMGAYNDVGDYSEAQYLLERIERSVEPNSVDAAEAALNRINLSILTGQWERAEKRLKEAFEATPAYAPEYQSIQRQLHAMAFSLAYAKGDFANARKHLNLSYSRSATELRTEEAAREGLVEGLQALVLDIRTGLGREQSRARYKKLFEEWSEPYARVYVANFDDYTQLIRLGVALGFREEVQRLRDELDFKLAQVQARSLLGEGRVEPQIALSLADVYLGNPGDAIDRLERVVTQYRSKFGEDRVVQLEIFELLEIAYRADRDSENASRIAARATKLRQRAELPRQLWPNPVVTNVNVTPDPV